MLINRLSRGLLMDGEPGGGGGLKKGDPVTLDAVNAAITAGIAKFAKDNLPGAIKDATKDLGASLLTITESLTTLQTSLTGGGGGGDHKGKPGEKGDDGLTPELRVRFAKYEKDAKDTSTALAQEKEKREVAEKAQKETAKHSAIRQALGQHSYASPEAEEDAFVLISGKVDFDPEDATRLLADGLPLNDFVASYIPEKKPHLLAAQGKGGAGAQGGGTKGGPSSKVQIEDITAQNLVGADGKVDPAKLSAFAGAIRAALPSTGPTR